MQLRVTLSGTGGELGSVVVTTKDEMIRLSQIVAEVESEHGDWLIAAGDTLTIEEVT